MATNKTIAPTGVTVQIPGLTDAPDMSVPANAIDKAIDGINALNSQIETYSFGQKASLSDFVTALNTYVSALATNSVRNVVVEFSASSAPFSTARYIGILTKTTDIRAQLTLHMHNGQQVIHGIQNETSWSWDAYAMNSQITTITTVSDTGTTSATGAINLTSLFNIYSGTRSIIGLYAESASYPNGIIGQPVKIGSSWFGIFTDTTGAIIASKSITVYATIAVVGFG